MASVRELSEAVAAAQYDTGIGVLALNGAMGAVEQMGQEVLDIAEVARALERRISELANNASLPVARDLAQACRQFADARQKLAHTADGSTNDLSTTAVNGLQIAGEQTKNSAASFARTLGELVTTARRLGGLAEHIESIAADLSEEPYVRTGRTLSRLRTAHFSARQSIDDADDWRTFF